MDYDPCDAIGPVPYPGADFMLCNLPVDHAGDHARQVSGSDLYSWDEALSQKVTDYLNAESERKHLYAQSVHEGW